MLKRNLGKACPNALVRTKPPWQTFHRMPSGMPKGPVVFDRQLVVRVPEDLLDGLGEIAETNYTTLAAISRAVLEEFVNVTRAKE